MSSGREAAPLADLVLRQVIDRVELLTRFDRRSLAQTSAETVTVPVTATIRHTVGFHRENFEGNGGLPAGVIPVAGALDLERHIEGRRAAAERGLPGRLQRWAESQPRVPAAPLVSANCFDEAPSAGYAYRCATCSGAGDIVCNGCGGHGDVMCLACGGRGHSQCGGCGGAGNTQCYGCGGSGVKTEHKTRMIWNSATQSNESQWYSEQVHCFNCGGTGRQQCNSCGGKGENTCFTCGGKGRVTCFGCGGRGRVSCTACGGTGSRFKSARLACKVHAQLSVHAATQVDESLAKLVALPSVASLDALAPVTRKPATVGDSRIETEYAASVPVTTLKLDAAGRTFEILGYGGAAVVENVKNIVGTLLESDLAQLEQQLLAMPVFALRTPAELESALSVVLESEMNASIYGGAGRGEAMTADGVAHSVSPEYVKRATSAIGRGLERVYRHDGLIGTAITLGVTAAVVFPNLFLTWGLKRPYLVVAIGIAAGAMSGYLYERRAFAQIQARFAGKIDERLIGLLKKSRLVRIWRYGTVGSAIALALAGYTLLPASAASTQAAPAPAPASAPGSKPGGYSVADVPAVLTAAGITVKGSVWLDKCGERVFPDTYGVDLNGDGQVEVFVEVTSRCYGTSGPQLTLLIKGRDDRWHANLGVPARGHQVLPTRNLGFPDIEILRQGRCPTVWRWNGQSYAIFKSC